ncbi:nicotinate (nicotinamide) nucleotide adenylyltransferase [Luteolibacter arcticus]|uniref:Probable nicotinate-nucleotide adenylyltransferase n=1 Tax=Luteolibacter arcticus TaxID=1581411 RepID=A0ABT3GMG5_9BACT|nr:nicotinate (nicotinamide) nucleotide adenylyltransferase [Luteolibacter arcticus]MCW1924687.1 nicotinate (nicotinamide) nucleotide adenylyltransferase [Luteolibacter arcticus]
MSELRRIALFGGTFDPIHLGHIEIARRAKNLLELDEVRFLPCHTSPHKLGVVSAPAKDRLEMARVATRKLPWAEVDDFDLSRPPPSYSYETAEEMTRRFPDAQLFWLMGADQWRALPQWREPERLAGLVEFIVFARDGDPEPHPGWKMHYLTGTHPASATAIREALAEGQTGLPWLDPDVEHLIRQRHLYTA